MSGGERDEVMARRKNQSMCEKTTMIAVNVIKASSFALAEMTLGLLRHAPARREVDITATAATYAPPLPQGMRLVEHESHSTGYVMAPEDGGGVDGMATAYIRKVHAKNRADEAGARSAAPELIPPPPAAKWGRHYHAR